MRLIRTKKQEEVLCGLLMIWTIVDYCIDKSEKEARKSIQDLLVRIAYTVGGEDGALQISASTGEWKNRQWFKDVERYKEERNDQKRDRNGSLTEDL